MGRDAALSVAASYYGLASEYDVVYGGDWDAAVDRQGAAIDELIRELTPGATRILDCSCGIGTQAIGLARHGYQVQGTDLSERAVARARQEAARLGVTVDFSVADFRDLSGIAGPFDVVISCDNALPHLLSDDDVALALREMRSKLRPGGILVVSIRDFDVALRERPCEPVSTLVDGLPRRILVRLHEWEPPPSLIYVVRFIVLTEDVGWTVSEHATRYRALTRDTLIAASHNAGFADARFVRTTIVGGQQVLVAVNS